MSLKSSDLEYCIKLRNKILERLHMTDEERELKEEEDLIRRLNNGQLKPMFNVTPEDYHNIVNSEEFYEYFFRDEIAKDELREKEKQEIEQKIKDLQENKDNQILEIVKTLQRQQTPQISTNKITFEELYSEFVQKKQADNDVSLESYQSYQATFNFTKNFFENQNLNELNYKNQDDLKIYLQNTESKGKLLSKVTLNNHIQTLSSFFHFGEDRELLEKNFLKNIKQFKEEKVEKDNFTDEQLLKILEIDKDKFYSYNKQRKPIFNYYNLFKICIYSGTRISEILKLKKENVKQDRFTIVDAKTENGNRTVPIHHILKKKDFTDLIDNLKVKYSNDKEEEEQINYHTKNANKILKKLDIDLKPKQTFHTLRATFIQKLINKDISKKALVQMLVGHSLADEDKLTLKTYAKKIDFELYQDLMQQFELK
ncbi:MAG: tyrosine-type recombinase/integrase [Candidatus Altimarinota bacterium]